MKIKNNHQECKVSLVSPKPLEKICFGFEYLSHNGHYGLKVIGNNRKADICIALLLKLQELSKIDIVRAHEIGKTTGMEKIPIKHLNEDAQKVCMNTGIVTNDSKIVIFRFGNQNFRIIGKDDVNHSNLVHIIAFDGDFSAYSH